MGRGGGKGGGGRSSGRISDNRKILVSAVGEQLGNVLADFDASRQAVNDAYARYDAALMSPKNNERQVKKLSLALDQAISKRDALAEKIALKRY